MGPRSRTRSQSTGTRFTTTVTYSEIAPHLAWAAMKASTLSRLGGLSLVLGGILGPFGHLVFHPPSHALQYQGTAQWVLAHGILAVSWVLILFGLFGLFGHLHERMGVIGLLSFVLVIVMCLDIIATYAFDAFTLPAILTTFPGEVATATNGSFRQFPNWPPLWTGELSVPVVMGGGRVGVRRVGGGVRRPAAQPGVSAGLPGDVVCRRSARAMVGDGRASTGGRARRAPARDRSLSWSCPRPTAWVSPP